MKTKIFTTIGSLLLFVILLLFVVFLSSSVDNGPTRPVVEKETYISAFNSKMQAVCILDSFGGHGFANKGKVFVSDGSILFEFEEDTNLGFMLMTDKKDLYIWMSDAEEGMLLTSNFIEKQGFGLSEQQAFMNTHLSDYLAERNEEGELFCEEDTFDLSLVTPPKDVDFISIADYFSSKN